MPSERKSQPNTAHFCERCTQSLSLRPSSSVEMAKANGTARPTYPTNSAGGWSTMPGCSRSGLRPNGMAPGSAATNGLEPVSKIMSAAKTAETTASTATAPAVRRSSRLRSTTAMTMTATASSRSQSRNEPDCPAQNPAMR